MTSSSTDPQVLARRALRQRLIEARQRFDADPAASSAHASLAGHLRQVLEQLEPDMLGLFWPMRLEFNAPAALAAYMLAQKRALALPFTRKSPREMVFRAWDGQAPRAVDEVGIPASDGRPVVPDVVLAPCVGFTDDGYRLGYGGGYFDRFLAAHPQVTTVGVAFSFMQLAPEDYTAQPHDRPLDLIVTEQGVHRT